jgi:hypothetical protein
MFRVMRRVGYLALVLIAWHAAPVSAQQIVNVSNPTDGSAANADPGFESAVSADGRFVLFKSRASNLVPDDTNGVEDLFVRDLQANTITLATIGTNGERLISDADNVGLESDGISADGRFVLFETASPLVPQDTNHCLTSADSPALIGCRDLYLRDLQTHQTTLVSQAANGTIGNDNSHRGSMSADGRFVLFMSAATNLTPDAPSGPQGIFLRDVQAGTTRRLDLPRVAAGSTAISDLRISGDGNSILYSYFYDSPATNAACPGFDECGVAAVMDRVSGVAQVLNLPAPPEHSGIWGLELAGISTNGRFALLFRVGFAGSASHYEFMLYDRQESRTVLLPGTLGIGTLGASLRGDGRAVIYTIDGSPDVLRLYDDNSHQIIDVLGAPIVPPDGLLAGATLSADGSHVVFGMLATPTTPGPPPHSNIYSFKLDSDGDGMIDAWETKFGLNPNDPNDATTDLDGDNRTNLQEYVAGTHPNGHFTRYLAEGSSNAVFSTRVAILNPGDTPALALVRLLGPTNAAAPSIITTIAPHKRITIGPEQLNGIGDFSTIVESDALLVVERTMNVTGVGHGAQGETAVVAPSTTWYFAEGATGGPFSLFYLLQNPGDVAAQVNVTYLLPAPHPPLTKTYTVAPRTRLTIFVDTEDPVLASADVSAKITSDQPIVAERSLYLASLNQPLGALEGGAGATASATRWFLAEGATGSFFDLYVLLANAETTDANVTLTYLLPDGTHFDKTYVVAAQSRRTILVDAEDPRLADTAVSVVAASTNGVPIVVERAMWWPESGWYEGHLSLGATTTAKKWALAEGEVGGPQGAQMYILIANTSNIPGTARVTAIVEDSAPQPSLIVDLPANSRTNVPVGSLVPLPMHPNDLNTMLVGAIIESDGVDLVVERSQYWNVGGVTWAAGTAALGAPIP